MPNQSELDLIFDTSYPDVQPYLFKVEFATSAPTNTSVGTFSKLRFEVLVYGFESQ
jgi:autophagy-related protein 101